jgi:predicted ester cyclase
MPARVTGVLVASEALSGALPMLISLRTPPLNCAIRIRPAVVRNSTGSSEMAVERSGSSPLWYASQRRTGPINHKHSSMEARMTEQDTTSAKQVLDRNITALNARDLEAYLANQQPDVEFSLPGGLTLSGRDELRQHTEALWAAFPDGSLSFGDQVFSEGAVATEVVFTGTHTGPMLTPAGPIPPTGKEVTLRSASILRIKGGLIASEHVYLDQLEMMMQLGLMPGAAGADDDHAR